jgi:DNA polymerase V
MTSDTRALVAAASRCLEAAWRDGFGYIKAGVLLDELCPPLAALPDLLDGPRPGSATLIAAMDRINARFGRGAVFPATVGLERAWAQRVAHCSPRYTTRRPCPSGWCRRAGPQLGSELAPAATAGS